MLDVSEDVARPEACRWQADASRHDDGGGDGGGGQPEKAPRQGRLDLRNSWQVVAGAILIPLGVVFIMIGWYGAAHARVVQQQIPYMVSGSFVGLGCMIVGGLLFWGHWLYRIYDQADLHHEEQQRLLEIIAASLVGQRVGMSGTSGAGPASGADGATGGAGDGGGAGGAGGTTFYATASGSVYHEAGCAVIAHHPDDLRVLGPSALAGMRPCQICLPA